MPLIKSHSKRALQKNIETEMDANPSPQDRKQNLAIAYSVQRRSKMARGGMAKSPTHAQQGDLHSSPSMEIEGPIECAHGGKAMCNMGCYAEGGPVAQPRSEASHAPKSIFEDSDYEDSPMRPDEQRPMPHKETYMEDSGPESVSEAIMRRRDMKKYAKGRVVEDNYMEAPADHGLEYNEEALKKELYDEDEIADLTYGSDYEGPSAMEEHDEEPSEEGEDHIAIIRAKMKRRPLSKM